MVHSERKRHLFTRENDSSAIGNDGSKPRWRIEYVQNRNQIAIANGIFICMGIEIIIFIRIRNRMKWERKVLCYSNLRSPWWKTTTSGKNCESALCAMWVGMNDFLSFEVNVTAIIVQVARVNTKSLSYCCS